MRRNRSLTPSFFEIESERRPCAPPSLPCVRASMWAMAAILCAVAAIMCETTAIMCATAAILSITFASMCATAAIMCAHRRVHVCHWARTCSARATRTRSVAKHVRVSRTCLALARDDVRHNCDHVHHGRVHVVSTNVRSVSAVAGNVSATRSLGACLPRGRSRGAFGALRTVRAPGSACEFSPCSVAADPPPAFRQKGAYRRLYSSA